MYNWLKLFSHLHWVLGAALLIRGLHLRHNLLIEKEYLKKLSLLYDFIHNHNNIEQSHNFNKNTRTMLQYEESKKGKGNLDQLTRSVHCILLTVEHSCWEYLVYIFEEHILTKYTNGHIMKKIIYVNMSVAPFNEYMDSNHLPGVATGCVTSTQVAVHFLHDHTWSHSHIVTSIQVAKIWRTYK